jgi:ABC-type uncharacterized transport system permease subunit
MRRLKTYLRVVRMAILSATHFRANLLSWVLYSPLQIVILVLLWRIVFSYTERVGGFGFEEMILYYLVVHLLRRVVEPVLGVNFEVWTEINKGTLDVYLARPLAYGPSDCRSWPSSPGCSACPSRPGRRCWSSSC